MLTGETNYCAAMGIEVTDGRVVRAGTPLHEMHCYDLETMISNPGQVDLGVRSTSVLSHT